MSHELTVKQLLVPLGAIATIVVATWQGLSWFDSRYVLRAELVALQAEVVELREDSERGDRIAQKAAEIFTATKFWADIVGREAMYKAQAEAGTITESGRVRWEDMRIILNNSAAELANLTAELEEIRRK